jgi:hypothetical protein
MTLMSNPSLLASMPAPIVHNLTYLREKLGGLNLISLIWKGLVGAHLAEATAMSVYVNRRGASLGTTVSSTRE